MTRKTEGWTYSKAGVNIDDKSSAIDSLVGELRYRRKGRGTMVPSKGLFASLIDFGDLYLTLATDGVGTKLLVAEELGVWDTVGIDCIAMNVNDTICVGAEPMSFVDYIAIDKPAGDVTKAIGVGLERGAEMSNMEIVGGEIAVLPEMVNGVDISGTCLGFVEKEAVVTGKDCVEGDLIVALEATGVHSNGLTLARKVFQDAGFSMSDKCQGLKKTVGMELLTPTEIYVKKILGILEEHQVHGLINITGGGLRNFLRMNPANRYTISDPVKPNPVFDVIADLGDVSIREMYQTFNMGMGFAIIAAEDAAEEIGGMPGAKVVGRVERGKGSYFEPEKLLYENY